MIRGFPEKQYQLAAQKKHEAHLKFKYYTRIADYFERECVVTKQYNSWLSKDCEISATHSKQKRKNENLQLRREKLRRLLQEEEKQLEKELEEKNLRDKSRRQQRRVESSSLEALRQRLLEKRSEQSLYLPNSRRSHRSYFGNSGNSGSSVDHSQKSFPLIFEDSNSPRSRVSSSSINMQRSTHFENLSSRDATTIRSQQYSSSSHHMRSLANTNLRGQSPEKLIEAAPEDACIAFEIKDDARALENDYRLAEAKSPRALQDTNLRPSTFFIDQDHEQLADKQDEVDETRDEEKEIEKMSGIGEEFDLRDEMNGIAKEETNSNEAMFSSTASQHGDVDDEYHHDSKLAAGQYGTHSDAKNHDHYFYKNFSSIGDASARHASDNWMKQNVDELDDKNLPRLGMGVNQEQNSTHPMFLYLIHSDIKNQLQDLDKRELHACQGRNWYDALRLRAMANKLHLERENKLLHAIGLDLDQVNKNSGLKTIENRKQALKEREDLWLNSVMYSEESKALLQKWTAEDEEFKNELICAQREQLMIDLEEEWNNMALNDKNCIEYQYEESKKKSSLQKDVKRAENIKVHTSRKR